MTQLYQMADNYRRALSMIEENDASQEMIAITLNALEGAFNSKAENVAFFIQELEVTAAAIDSAVQNMQQRKQAIIRNSDRIRDYLKNCMEATGTHKIECPHFRISIKRNPPKAEIFDEKQIPEEYWQQPEAPPKKIDRRMLLDDLKQGVCVEGVALVQETRLEIK